MATAQVKKVSFTHEALIQWMLENPSRHLRDAAEYFGYTQSWLSTIIHSDAFKQQLIKRQNQVAFQVAADIPSRLRGAAHVALEGLTRQLETTEDPEFLLDATDKLLRNMGYGPASSRNPGGQTITNNTQNNTFLVSSDDLAEARALIGSAPSQVQEPVTIEYKPE